MSIKITEKRIDPFAFLLSILLLAVAVVYFKGLTADIYGGDVGDLVTAAVVGGVAHPPGYPLFTLLGFFLSHLNFDFAPVTRVGLVSLLASMGSLIVFWKITKLFVSNKFIQLLSIATLAFSYHFWLFTEIPEVFMLNVFLSLCIVYVSVSFYKTKKFLQLLLIAFFLGLALTNHMTALLLSPFVLFILINKRYTVLTFRKRLALFPVVFLLGLLPFLYIPIAAVHNPVLNWDDAKNLPNFLNLVLRRDYGTFSAGIFPRPVFELRSLLLKNYSTSIISSLSLPVVIVSLLGFFSLIKREKYLSVLVLVTILITGPLFVLYAAFPLNNNFVLATVERFYLLSEVLIVLLFPWGLELIYAFCRKVFSKKIYASIILAVFLLVPILQFTKTHQKTDLSHLQMGNEFGKDFFRNLPPKSLLLVEGDTKSFNSWYVHFVLHFRPDIELVEAGNFAVRNDYFNSVYEKVKKGKKYDELSLFFTTLEQISITRPVFSSTQLNFPDKKYIWLPRGIGYQLIKKEDFPEIESYRSLFPSDFANINIPERDKLQPYEHNLTTADIPTYYADAFTKIGDVFFNNYGDFSAAAKYYKYATVIDPQFSQGYAGKSKVESQYGNCMDADYDMKHAIDLYPIDKSYYFFWYFNAVNCFKNKEKITSVSNFYYRIFHQDIKKDITKEVSK